jgi:hypothetical protein
MGIVSASSSEAIEQAAQLLAQGGLVAIPTETVYGLAAHADDDAAVAQIFVTKGRPSDHPLIVHVLGREQALTFAIELAAAAEALDRGVLARSGNGDRAACAQPCRWAPPARRWRCARAIRWLRRCCSSAARKPGLPAWRRPAQTASASQPDRGDAA